MLFRSGLSDNQKEIIEILTQQFRVKNGFDKELSDDEYKLLGKIVVELTK